MEIEIKNIETKHAQTLRELQLICFPSTDPDELFFEKDLIDYAEVFPEGNFVAVAGERVIGLGAGGFYTIDFDDLTHSMHIPMHNSIGKWHSVEGEYYYGTDISVHPEYRRYGIGTKLYQARKEIVKKYNKRGIIAGGFIPGFANHKDKIDVSTYVEQVVAGTLYDSTLSFQIRHGFRVAGLL
ncbi:MAG: GNAT family N-acetyltransferase, partial [Chloroflexota bacterium]